MSGPNLLAICHTAKLSNKSAAFSVLVNGDIIFGSWKEEPPQTPLNLFKTQWISIKTVSKYIWFIPVLLALEPRLTHIVPCMPRRIQITHWIIRENNKAENSFSTLWYILTHISKSISHPTVTKILDFKMLLWYKGDKEKSNWHQNSHWPNNLCKIQRLGTFYRIPRGVPWPWNN